MNPGRFGHDYGQGTNYSRLRLQFNDDGQDKLLSFRGFDIDRSAELVVRLNGIKVGWATPGRNNGLSPARSQFYLPKELQNNPSGSGDVNVIDIIQRYRGDRWGVTQLLLEDPQGESTSVAAGQRDTTAYGWNYGSNGSRDTVTVTVPGNGNDQTISMHGYDLNIAREVLMFVNGKPAYVLGGTASGYHSARQFFTIPAAQLNLSSNRVVFVQNNQGERWGLKGIKVTSP